MTASYRLLAVVISLAAMLGCDGGDSLAPRDLAGIWISARIQPANVMVAPDTLRLDARGTGRLVVRAFVGDTPPYREEWWTSDVFYEVRDDRAYFNWCPSPPGTVADCGGWNASGHLEDRRTMVVVPTSPISSVGPTPWVRIAR